LDRGHGSTLTFAVVAAVRLFGMMVTGAEPSGAVKV
jgi:hypothetical protein